jgi:magnesium transporter
MSRPIKRISRTKGLPPGALVHVGEKKTEKVKITLLDYDASRFEEKEFKNVEESFAYKDAPGITWINIDGIHQIDIIEKIGNHFGFHPLTQEDILNTEQRPKLEDFDGYLFIVLKMVYLNGKKNEIIAEQISLVIGSNYVVSFQEREGDVFNSIRERIRNDKGRIRKMGADYLAYALTDAIVDNYFVVLESVGENIEFIEQKLISDPKPKTLQQIHQLKGSMIYLRKSVWPLREVISGLQRMGSPLIKETTEAYLRDVYDHTIQVVDSIETYRDILSGLLDVYLSSVSNRMNEVMKVLTIIATIFIPLTFIAGIYGMNFRYMPELGWRSGYFIILGIMAIIAVFMLLNFRRKKWL